MYKNILMILGMPRSGTSWLGQILDSSPEVRFRNSPLFSYEFKNQVDKQSSVIEWKKLFSDSYESENEFMSQSIRRLQGHYPAFEVKDTMPGTLVIKDTRFHELTARLLELFDELKVIYLVRNPCGAINSWLNSAGEFPLSADPFSEWRTGSCRKPGIGEYWGFDDWKKVANQYLILEERFSERVLIQQYEDIVDDAENTTIRLFKFCGLEVTEQTQRFLRISQCEHQDNQYAVFKSPNVATAWKNELSPQIREQIESEIIGSPLERFWQ